jgi:hypothetical protein
MLDQDLEVNDILKHLDASQSLSEEMGVYQHHDAVAGTER